MKTLLGSLPVMLLSLTLASNLSAAVCVDPSGCVFTFNTTNGGTAGNFGTVTLTTVGANILVDVHLAPGRHLIDVGEAHQAFDFSDSLGGVAFSLTSFSNAQYTQDPGSAPFHDDGFGSFGHAVDTTAGAGAGTTGVNELTFKVLGHTNVNDLVGLSSGGINAYFAADIFADASACGATGFGGSCTGLVGVTGGGGNISGVPEPGSYLGLLMSGLVGMLLVERRRRNRLTSE